MSSVPSSYVDELNVLNREISQNKPEDVLQFCADYFNRRLREREQQQKQQQQAAPSFKSNPFDSAKHQQDIAASFSKFNTGSFSIGDPREAHTSRAAAAQGHLALPQDYPRHFNANRRTSVSAESIIPGAHGRDTNLEPIPDNRLTEEQLERLNKSVENNFLFSQLDSQALHMVLNAMTEKKVAKGTTIIKEGDEGDYFYIVESGTVDFYKLLDGENKQVNTSGAGSSFGELALMHNSPRAATVVAATDCVLWALDRVTFRRILLDRTASKRAMYGGFLREVPILKVLSHYELSKLADALNTENYKAGDVIVREGEHGEQFYIIEEGEAIVSKQDEGEVAKLKKGDYFGEIALLNDSPRQATVTATGPLKLVTLGKSGFQRLLGEVVDILKTRAPATNISPAQATAAVQN
ncbi:cAMP-dependent protein kinase regulatory subunit [Trichomonascus vanleenenianus]|uniref:cAMP-dependent protein kinase regulatory subunit BCY1 n=1 Tax=Trichomonascus vanleenenianus TaxID=2268995 RepID=UPI003EC9E368